MYLGSDAIALAPFTNSITYLEDGDWAVVRRNEVTIFDMDGEPVERKRQQSLGTCFMVDKGNHRHFMEKEIHEQPEVIGAHAGALSRFRQRRVEAARPAVRFRQARPRWPSRPAAPPISPA